jgi:hypothetical protein
MAEIRVSDDELELHLSVLEATGAFHGSIRVPLSSVTAARVIEHPTDELRGLRVPGTSLPGVVELGTWVGSFGKDFWAVDKPGAAVILELEGQKYERLIASQKDPDAVVRALGF